METYFAHKHKLITAYDMTHINWSGLKSFMTKHKMHPRSIAAKYIHGWLPTQAFLHKQARTPSPCCPICINSFLPEMAAHILMCQHRSAITAHPTLLEYIHGKTIQENHVKTQEAAIVNVKNIYSNPPSLL